MLDRWSLASRPPSTRPSGSGHAVGAATTAISATGGNQARGSGGGSARLARVDGGRASRSRSAPAGGCWSWEHGPGREGLRARPVRAGAYGPDYDGRTTIMAIEA